MNPPNAVATLGDVGPHDDYSYTGEQSTSVLSMDYYRDKAREFQVVMNALDQSWQAARAALSVTDDPGLIDYLQSWLADYDDKRWRIRATAEAVNMGAAMVNAAGGRMPVLSIPGTLGFAPLMPAAAIAAFGAIATLAAWGLSAISGLNERLKFSMAMDAQTTPEAKAQLAQAVATSDSAAKLAESSQSFGLAALAPLFKWVAIAGGAFLAWKAYKAFVK